MQTDIRARRATVEDLPQLQGLWRIENLPVEGLEKRFTEFQVVVDEAGCVLGAVGLQISSNHGLLHGEAIGRPELVESVREMLWQRIQMVCRNHNVDRIWTRLNYSYWRAVGFRQVTKEELETLPLAFGEPSGVWQLLLLRGAEGSADAIEKQFAMLRALHAQEAQQMQNRVAVLKKVALGLTALVAALVIVWAVVLFRYGPKFLQRGQ